MTRVRDWFDLYKGFVSCSSDTALAIWDTTNSEKPCHLIHKHKDYVRKVKKWDNGQFVSAGLDRCLFLWRVQEEDGELFSIVDSCLPGTGKLMFFHCLKILFMQ